MKKAILTSVLLAVTLLSAWAGAPDKLQSLAGKYKGEEGFEMVSMGRLGLRLIRGVAKASGDLDQEDKAALKVFSGLKKLIIIDFEDIPANKKAEFTARAEKILGKMDLIMEAKDGDDAMSIYGIDDGECVRDCVLYSRDGALIVTKGSLNFRYLDQLKEVAK